MHQGHTDPPCKQCEIDKIGPYAEKGCPPKTRYQETLDFIDQLRSRGVVQFIGLDLNLTLDPNFVFGERTAKTDPGKPETVKIDGIEMDKQFAEDLFGAGNT